MAKYLILCADTAGDHKHVTGVRAVKWRPRKGGYRLPSTLFSRDEVASLITLGDRFFTSSLKGTTPVSAEVEAVKCRDCTERTIRTKGDADTGDNLDFMGPCG